MDQSKKKDLISLLEAGYSRMLVFKSAMLVFFPDEACWGTRNADSFFRESDSTIEAVIEFINEYHSLHSSEQKVRFNTQLARKCLTEKASDIKKKLRKLGMF